MQTVCFCLTWRDTLFPGISSGRKADEEPSLIGWISKQITRPSDIGGGGRLGYLRDWLQARVPGFALLFD